MRGSWLGFVVVVCLVTVAAADADKRRQLRDEIDRLLSDIAGELRDVPSDSSTSDLDRTVDYAGKVYDKARELKDQAEGDSDAAQIADRYPDIAKRYQEAARYLRELKNGYRKIDEWPKKCEAAMRELSDKLRAYTDSRDPRGIEEVPNLAREQGRIGKEALEQAERTKNEMYSWTDQVGRFGDSDGKWSDVRGNLSSASRTMYEYTVKQYEQVKRDDTCGNLAKEDRNPLVEQAMQKLFEGKKGIEALYEALDRQVSEMASALTGVGWAFEAACTLEVLCRPADAARFADTIMLFHDLVAAVGARTGTLGIWPSYDLALHDATLVRTILDTRWGEYDISLPPAFSAQVQLVQSERKFVGTTYARHPRWGTYLNAAHVAAIGGVERIRAEVAPAQITAVGDLTYIQLTESWEAALTAEAEQRRQALERVMAPIVVRE